MNSKKLCKETFLAKPKAPSQHFACRGHKEVLQNSAELV